MNEEQELYLLKNGTPYAKRQYILWYGFTSPKGQIELAQSDVELIHLQGYIYGDVWNKEAMEILRQRGLLPSENEEDTKVAFLGWLSTALVGERKNEAEYGELQDYWLNYSSEDPMPHASEEEQISWFNQRDIHKIVSYEYNWRGQALIRFIKEAPEEVVYKYLHYNLLKREDAQLALIERDEANDENELIWFYFHQNRACLAVQEKLQKSEPWLWSNYMIVLNYGWDNIYERRARSLRNWQDKLEANIYRLANCPVEHIPYVLDTIK